MCQGCSEHAKKAWYLNENNHRTDFGLREKVRFYKAFETFENAAKFMFWKKKDFGKIAYKILNWYSKNIHGGQIVPSVDQTLEIIDKAHDFGVTYCICEKAAYGGKLNYKCLYLNAANKIFRKDHPDKIKFLTKDEAKNLVLQKRKEGAYQSVLWGPYPNVTAICNCEQSCGSFQIPGVKSAFYPAIFHSSVVNKKKCIRCGKCARVCHFGAIAIKNDGCAVDPLKCGGCGLCIDACQDKVLAFQVRTEFFDPASRSWVGPKSGSILDTVRTAIDRERMRIKLRKENPLLR
jgi:Pyruvate/2-oxoacid:ferredoxin oxidoreductase delta subunit